MALFKKQQSRLVNIKDIKPTASIIYKVNVQVLCMWKVVHNNVLKAIEMVLVDDEGTRVHATLDADVVKKYQDQFAEGESVTINTFGCVPYTSEYKTNPLSFKIAIQRGTKVTLFEKFPLSVPENYFEEFDDIIAGKISKKKLFDVIGQIVSIGSIEEKKTKWKTSSTLTIVLRSPLDTRLKCTLWDDYAQQIIDYKAQNPEGDIVFLMRFASAKEYKGDWYVSNGFNTSKIQLNASIPIVEKFKTMLPPDNLLITEGENSSQLVLSAANPVCLHDEFFVKNAKKTIEEIVSELQEGRCVTCATVTSIDLSQMWYYIACKSCNKKVVVSTAAGNDNEDDPQEYDCIKCGPHVTDVVARYYLVFRVTDSTGQETKFLFWDSLAEKLLGKSALELANQSIESEDPSALPEEISKFHGNTLLFKINISEDNIKTKNQPFTVTTYWTDQSMVEKFLAESSNGHSSLMLTNSETNPASSPLFLTNTTENSETSLASSVTPVSKRKETVLTSSNRSAITKKIKLEE